MTSASFSRTLWDAIKEAGGDKERLVAILTGMERNDLMVFHKEFYRALYSLWAESDNGGWLEPAPVEDLSDDTQEDIFAYVVSKGRDYYDEIIAHPERLRRDTHPSDVPFLGVGRQVFLERFGEEIDLLRGDG